jgi:hypothetical protein
MKTAVLSGQLDVFNQPPFIDGMRLRDAGMKQAIDHAELNAKHWSEAAYKFLLFYLQDHDEFMTEDVRNASVGIVPEPPSLRAWGSIIRRAVVERKIAGAGYRPVTNPLAHRTPANVWRRIL